MEVARPSGGLPQHKRKGSALDQLQLDQMVPGSGKAARPSSPEEAEPAEPAAEPAPLTEAAREHLMNLRNSQEQLVAQIDELTGQGLALLDNMRANWLQRMAQAKGDLARLLQETQEQLQRDSAETLDLRERCRITGGLVERLNIKVDTHEPAAQQLFTAEEEGTAAHAGADEGEEAAS